MSSDVATEILKLNFTYENSFIIFMFIIATTFFLALLSALLYTMRMQDHYGFYDYIILTVVSGVLSLLMGIIIFTPLSLTKKTEISTESLKIIKVEDDISNADQLKLLVKSNDGKISTKKVNINDKNTIVKISSSEKSFTEKNTKITYSTDKKINAALKNIPKNESKQEITVYLPTESIK